MSSAITDRGYKVRDSESLLLLVSNAFFVIPSE